MYRFIHASAPYRVSLFGGTTDFPEFYKRHGGLVISLAIDRRCNIFLRPTRYLDSYYRISWRHVEVVDKASDILHPAVRGALRYFGVYQPIELHHIGELSARTGIGSSSAFAVALIAALEKMEANRKGFSYVPDPRSIAVKAIELERGVLREAGGIQDQIASAYGGAILIKMSELGFDCQPLPSTDIYSLLDSLFLVDTNTTRDSMDNARDINREQNDTYRLEILRIAHRALDVITSGTDLDEIGPLLHESWQIKKQLGDHISTPELDSLYLRLLDVGATGGKAIGSGGGGYLLVYVPKKNREQFLREEGGMPVTLSLSGIHVGEL